MLGRGEELNHLSNDLILSVHILKTQPTWFRRMKEELNSVLSDNQISHSIDTLMDWGIVEMFYGETSDNKCGNLFRITEWSESMIIGLLNDN